MTKNNIYTEKDSLGSKPNKKSNQEEWVEESFSTDTPLSDRRTRRKPSKQLKKK